jgi:hypothetical protein
MFMPSQTRKKKKKNLEECIKYRLQDRFVRLYVGLPSILIINLWWAQNKIIFKDKLMHPEVLAALTISQSKELKEKLKEKRPWISILSDIDYQTSWGYFNGANQGNPPMCGVGMVLFINHNHYIHIRYAPGLGTNNREKFLALWTFLETTKKKDVKKLQVMGDLKLVIY